METIALIVNLQCQLEWMGMSSGRGSALGMSTGVFPEQMNWGGRATLSVGSGTQGLGTQSGEKWRKEEVM